MINKEEGSYKNLTPINNRVEKMTLIEKLREMGFSEQEIEYNFSQSDKELELSGSQKGENTKN